MKVLTRTPLRISLFGGGTDLKEYYENSYGKALSLTFNKYCYVLVTDENYYDDKVFKNVEIIDGHNYDGIKNNLIKQIAKFYALHGIKIYHNIDVGAGSGLATSSALAVGLVNAINKYRNVRMGKMDIADAAIYFERILCNELGGIQDQYAVALGGLNEYTFRRNDVVVTNHDNKMKCLCNNLYLVHTGIYRNSHYIQQELSNEIMNGNAVEHLDMIKEIAETSIKLLNVGKYNEFGKLLSITWEEKRKLTKNITNSSLDELYNNIIESGAIGAKLLGAGSGGYFICYVPDENKKIFEKSIKCDKIVGDYDGTKII